MSWREIAGLLIAAAVLLLAGLITNLFRLWSFLANFTVPWFCSAVAMALCILVITALLTNASPSSIPVSRVLAVIMGSVGVIGIGMVVDAISYGSFGDWTASIGEWAGFTLILSVVFWIPRCKH